MLKSYLTRTSGATPEGRVLTGHQRGRAVILRGLSKSICPVCGSEKVHRSDDGKLKSHAGACGHIFDDPEKQKAMEERGTSLKESEGENGGEDGGNRNCGRASGYAKICWQP